MADNVAITPGSGAFAACDEVAYSGDTAKVQIVRLVSVSGSEGSKTLSEICDASNGLDVDVTRVSGTVTVANGGTFAVQESGGALTALQLLDDAVYVDDADWTDDASKHILVGGVYQSSPHTVTDGDVSPLLVDANGRLSVSVSGTVTVGSHAVTNAGAFAVQESGGALTALQVIDDWDESDRAKVNPIVGQAGVAAGAGAVGATTQRVTLASDDPAVAALQILDNAVSGSEMQVDVVGSLPAGNNNIGDVDIASIAAGDNNIGNVDIASAIPAGTNLIGKTSVAFDTDAIYQGATARTIGRAIIDAASSGDNTLLAAQGSGNKIRVHSLFMVADDAVTARFESGASGTALTGQMSLAANGGFVLPFNPLGWFETAANTLLNLELNAAVSVDGSFQYSVVQ